MNRIKSFLNRAAVATGAVVLPLAAHAEGGVDVTTVTTAITAAGVAIATVGAAVLVIKVGGKVWKWVTGAL